MNNSSLNWGNGSSGTSPGSSMEPNGGWNKVVLDVWHCGDMTANSPPSLIHHAHRWSTSYCGFNISMWRKSKKVHFALNTNVFCPPTGTKLPRSEKKKKQTPKSCSYQLYVCSGLKDEQSQKTCHQPNVTKMKGKFRETKRTHPRTQTWQG